MHYFNAHVGSRREDDQWWYDRGPFGFSPPFLKCVCVVCVFIVELWVEENWENHPQVEQTFITDPPNFIVL